MVTVHRAISPAGPDIVGRALELETIGGFLRHVPRPAGATALLIEGEAGIGKSTLWKVAIRDGRDAGMTVLQSAPAVAEQGLSFVALRDLIGDLASAAFDHLPSPQRHALDAALLRQPVEQPVDPGAVAAALTSVLRRLGEDQPTLIAVDDTQWLDPPSARVLAYALRRLGGISIRVLLTRRTGEADSVFDDARMSMGDRAQGVLLGPMSFGALHRLIAARTGHRFARPVVARIEHVSRGNPMTAIEIARALLETGATEPRPGEELPVPERLRDLLDARLARLTSATRAAILLAAALSHPRIGSIERASVKGAAARAALKAAETAGIIAIDGDEVEFAHPLFASVLLAGVTSATLRGVHARLADVATNDEERAYHLGRAATDPDAHLADQLEAAAHETTQHGAPELGAELLARATELTPAADEAGRARRVVHEAEARLEAGDTVGCQKLLEGALAWMNPGAMRAQALLLLGTAYWYLDPGRATGWLEEALIEAAGGPTLSGRIHSRLALFLGDVEASRTHARRAVELIDPTVDPSALAFALFGLFYNDVRAGTKPDLRMFERALRLEPEMPTWEVSTIPALWWSHTGAHDRARTRLERHLQWARDSGDASSDADLEAHLAELELYDGRWAAADAAADRSIEAAEQMGQIAPNASHRMRALVDVHVGALEIAVARADEAASACQGADPELEAMYLQVVGTARLALGEHAAAVAAFDRVVETLDGSGIQEPLRYRFEADHVESLLEVGESELAAAILRKLERRHERLPRAWIAADLPRARALVQAAAGDIEGAVALLDRETGDVRTNTGTGHPDSGAPSPGSYSTGRSLLLLGRLERRLGRRRLAGEHLDRAIAIFDGLPAPAWAAQARSEAARLGRRRDSGDALTPAESRVVELIATGLTNRAVAERLVISPKTVEAHVARAYVKLGIRSRAELGQRLADPSRGTPSRDGEL